MAEAVAININHFLFYYSLLYYITFITEQMLHYTTFMNKQPMCNNAKFIFY